MKYCYNCKTLWEEKHEPPSKEGCLKCGFDMHVCLNCRFYDTAKSNACAIDGLEPVMDKSRFNYCDEFSFRDSAVSRNSERQSAKAKSIFENLFKKPDD